MRYFSRMIDETPDFAELKRRPGAYSFFLWYAATLYLAWSAKRGVVWRNRGWGFNPRLLISQAHDTWIAQHPDRAQELYEVIAEVDRVSHHGWIIPREACALLSAVYQEMNVSLWERLWN